MHPARIQKIRAEKSCMQIPVQCDPHVARGIYKCLALIADNGLRAQELPIHFRVKFGQERIRTLQKEADFPGKQLMRLLRRKAGAAFGTQPAFFYLLFQPEECQIPVIISQPQ